MDEVNGKCPGNVARSKSIKNKHSSKAHPYPVFDTLNTLIYTKRRNCYNQKLLQDIYDIAARAAPRCIAVQHIAAFWKDISRIEPEAAITS